MGYINKKTAVTACLLLSVLTLTACGSRKGTATTVTATPTVTAAVTATPIASMAPTTLPTAAPTTVPMASAAPTPLPIVTTVPTAAPTTVPTATPTPMPVVTATPTPIPATPTPTPTPRLPVITKSPTDETVDEGGSCWFVAKYENAEIAVWHFISPDGQTDLTYEAAQKYFPTMEILNGMYSSMQLKNIPYAANGWRVYCRYSNPNGYVDTGTALITVRPGVQTSAAESYSYDANSSTTVIVADQGLEGVWQQYMGRATMTVSWIDTGRYRVEVNWGSSAFETACWTMTLNENTYNSGTYDNGEYYVQTFRDDGSYSISDEHKDGTGSVTLYSDGTLHWYDSYNGYEVEMVRVS